MFEERDIHVHVPEGATPKDGPSAGVAMVTAIVSVMTGIPVRRDLAMTGEITLRGRVWPIAGLKEKLLAALRGGIKTVLIPEENAKDLVEIADSIKSGLEIVPVSRMDEVLARAMTRKPEPVEWDETTTIGTWSWRKPRRSPRIERSRHRCRGRSARSDACPSSSSIGIVEPDRNCHRRPARAADEYGLRERGGALAVAANPFFFARHQQLVALAAHHAIPAIYEWRDFAEAGGLVSYGTNLAEANRQAGNLYRADSQGRQARPPGRAVG